MPLLALKKALDKDKVRLEDIEKRLKSYLYNITVFVNSLHVRCHSDSDQELFKFQSPHNLRLNLFKTKENCGFDLMGFKFTSINNLQLLSLFSQNYKMHLNMICSHPAIDKGFEVFARNQSRCVEEKNPRKVIERCKSQTRG